MLLVLTEVLTLSLPLITASINQVLLTAKLLSKRELLIPSFVKSYRCVRLHHQDEGLRLLVNEKTVGCKILIIKYQRHSLKTIQSILSLFWKICLVFVMPQNEFVPKIGMCLYHGLSMTSNRSLSIKLNRISLP